MKIPKGMTEAQVLEIIDKVSNRLASRFRFGCYEKEDIKQEAFIMAIKALDNYCEDKPLENFLFVHIRNRLKNFKRDNYVRKNYICTFCKNQDPSCENCRKRLIKRNTKQFLIEPLDIGNINDEHEPNMWDSNEGLNLAIINEYMDIIDKYLDIEYRADYLKIKVGLYIPKPRRTEIESVILNILEEHGYENG